MKCKAKKAFFAGKNDIYHRWKEVKKLNGKWLGCAFRTDGREPER